MHSFLQLVYINQSDVAEKKSFVPIWRFFPNIITLLGLCSGLTAIKYTFHDKWEMAVIFILVAAIIDGMDGRIARILDSSTEFGAQLDSLADLINFGVAPGLLLYFYSLVNIKVLGWALIMAFVMCIAIRLARFNVESLVDEPAYKKNFFVGVPAPIGALLLLFPVIVSFNEIDSYPIFFNIIFNHYAIAFYSSAVSILVVSRIPTFSAKNLHIASSMESISTFVVGVVIVLLLAKPWIVIPLISLIYFILMPFSAFLYYKMKSQHDETEGGEI